MKRLFLILGLLLGCAFPAFAKPLYLSQIGPSFACQSIAHAKRCVVVNVQGYEVATTLTIPNSFTPNTPALSAQVNQNFNTIASWANGNVDSTNVGTAGINPSVVKCSSTFTCTFGSAQTYIFNPASAAVVPLSVSNALSPSADYVDVTSNGASAGNVLLVGPNGNMSTQGIVLVTPTSTPAASAVWLQNDTLSPAGAIFNVPASSTQGVQFQVNNTTTTVKIGKGGTGGLLVLFGGGAGLAYVPPDFFCDSTPTCVASIAGEHINHGVFSTTISGTCNNLAVCTLSPNSITWPANQQFGSSAHVTCTVSENDNPPLVIVSPINNATTLLLAVRNVSGAGISGSIGFYYSCDGD